MFGIIGVNEYTINYVDTYRNSSIRNLLFTFYGVERHIMNKDKIRVCEVCNKELRRKHYGPDWICVKTGCPYWIQDIKERVRRLTGGKPFRNI